MSITREQAESAPHAPGVYTFRRGSTPIYIGKAVDLSRRLASYFRRVASDKVRRLRAEATALDWVETRSEIEALIREAGEIKRHMPRFNVLMRDDKDYFYVGFTREEYPRIFITHQPQRGRVRNQELGIKKNRNSKFIIRDSRYMGPFTSGSALRSTLKILRRVFPYCTCKTPHKRPCLNAQIGRCPGYCCLSGRMQTVQEKKEYQDTVIS